MVRRLFVQLSRESFIYGLSAAIAKLIGFILVPLYTHTLTQDDFGRLSIITTGTGILAALLILGLDNATALTFYQTDEAGERRVIASTLLFFELGLSAGIWVLLFALAQPIAFLIWGSPAFTGYVQLAVSTVPFATFMTVFLDIARLVRLPWRYLTLAVGSLLLTTLLIVIGVVGWHLGLVGVLGATLAGNAAFSLIGWILTRPQYGRLFSAQTLRRMLALGIPLVPATIAYWVISFSNQWFLLYMASSEQVAILAFATRLCAPVVLIVTAFQIAWVPFSLSIAREEAAGPVYARTLLYFLALTFGTLLLLILAADPLIRIFGTPAYLPAAAVLAPVGLSSVAYGAYYIVATGVNLAGRTMHIGWTTVVAALVSIGLNLALIPVLGILGAALAGLVANLIPVVLLYIVAQRLHFVPYDLPRAGLLVGLGLGLLVLAAALPTQGLALDLALRIVLLLTFMAALFVIGIVRVRDLRMLGQLLRGAVRLESNP